MYPVNLILDDKPCVVIGGGHVALRKVEGLLEAKAKVTVISPVLVNELTNMVQNNLIIWKQKYYETGDLNGFELAVCAVGEDSASKQIYEDAHKARILINVVDKLPLCDFALPAKIRRGDLLVTFSTNSFISSDDTYASWLDRLSILRNEAIAKLPTSNDREIFWRSALSDDVMQLVKQKKYDEAEDTIKNAINSFRPQP